MNGSSFSLWSAFDAAEVYNGYRIIRGTPQTPPQRKSISISDIFRFEVHKKDALFGHLKTVKRNTRGPVQLHNQFLAQEDGENLLRRAIADLPAISTSDDYLISEAHLPAQRAELGLPNPPLQTSERLLCTRVHHSGIHSTWGYLSEGVTYTFFHKEDLVLKSVNWLHYGMAKVWVIVPGHGAKLLESQIAKMLDLTYTCDQFIRHANVIITPDMLDEWQVPYSIVVQNAGTVVVTDYGAYHYVFNSGPNVAEAVNGCTPEWIAPVSYLLCQSCVGQTSIKRLKDYDIGRKRPLTVVTTHTPAPVHTSEPIRNLLNKSLTRRPKQSGHRKRNGALQIRNTDSTQCEPSDKTSTDGILTKEETKLESAELWTLTENEGVVEMHGMQDIINGMQEIVNALVQMYEFSLPGLHNEHHASQVFSRFLPGRGNESWLDDIAVFGTLEMIVTHNNRFMAIDPQGVQRIDTIFVDYCPENVTVLLIPFHSFGNHWSLIAVDKLLKLVTCYDQLNEEVKSWFSEFNKDAKYRLKTKEPLLSNASGADCGVSVLAQAENLVRPGFYTNHSLDPVVLRDRFLSRIQQRAEAERERRQLSAKMKPTAADRNKKQYTIYNTVSREKLKGVPDMDTFIHEFASPAIFSDLCSYRQLHLHNMRCFGTSAVAATLYAWENGRHTRSRGFWQQLSADVTFYYLYRELLGDVSGKTKRKMQQRRKDKRKGNAVEDVNSKNTIAMTYDRMLDGITSEGDTRSHYRKALQEHVRRGRRFAKAFDFEGGLTQFWMLAPKTFLNKISKMDKETVASLMQSIFENRPKLRVYYKRLCAGLKVVANPDGTALPIDTADPFVLASTKIDSASLLDSLTPISALSS